MGEEVELPQWSEGEAVMRVEAVKYWPGGLPSKSINEKFYQPRLLVGKPIYRRTAWFEGNNPSLFAWESSSMPVVLTSL